jgi:hypothetical protein
VNALLGVPPILILNKFKGTDPYATLLPFLSVIDWNFLFTGTDSFTTKEENKPGSLVTGLHFTQ